VFGSAELVVGRVAVLDRLGAAGEPDWSRAILDAA
jgi:hypothetical protein